MQNCRLGTLIRKQFASEETDNNAANVDCLGYLRVDKIFSMLCWSFFLIINYSLNQIDRPTQKTNRYR